MATWDLKGLEDAFKESGERVDLSKFSELQLEKELSRRKAGRKAKAVDALNACSLAEAVEAVGACAHDIRLTVKR